MLLRRRPEIFAVLLALSLIAALASVCAAQGPVSGTIRGVAVDAHGQPVALAEVSARNIESGEQRQGKASPDGTFTFAALPPGDYAIQAGTGSLTVALAPGAEIAVRANLHGAVTLVNGGALPGTDLPGAATFEPDENDDGLLSAQGLAETQSETSVDGVNATQNFSAVPLGNGSDAAVDPDDDADSADLTTGPSHGLGRGRHAGVAYTYAQGSVREFRLGTDIYSAQSGGAGGIITQTTRAGGERWHGGAFFDLRSSALAARDPLAIATSYQDGLVTSGEVKPHDLRGNFGLTVGGPVPRLKTARMFYAFDEQRRGFPAISSPANANFYNLTAIQTALLANRGVSAQQTEAALNFLSSVTGKTDRRADQTINFGRLDWRPKPRLGVGMEYNRVRWNSPAGLLDAPVVARGRASLGNAAGSVDQVLLRLTPSLTARTQSEARIAFTRDLQYETPQAPLPQEAAISPGGLSPEIDIGPDGLLFGTPASLSQQAYPDEQRIEAGELVTLVRGHHLVEFGGTYAVVEEKIATLANSAGTFRYDSGTTNGYDGGLVDFITDSTFNVHVLPNGGCPSIYAADHLPCFRSYSQSFGEQRVAFSTSQAAGFVEDTWRLSPERRRGLMLHAGLRYDAQLLPAPQQPNPALDAVFSAHGATSRFPADRNNFGPRISATFEPLGQGRGVVKLGYGIFYGRMPGATLQSALSDTGLPSSTTKIRLRPSAVIGCPQVMNQGFGYLCSFPSEPAGAAAQTTSAMVFDRRFRLPTVQQASLSVERELGRRTTLSVGYVWNQDYQLPTSTDLNIAPSNATRMFQLRGGTGRAGVRDGETFVLPAYEARISTDFGPVTDIVSNANATYNGLVLKADTRAVRGLQLNGTYTWSKAIDFDQSSSAIPRTNGQLDPFTNGYDKGLSSLNYPQALHATAVWTPATENARRGLRQAANGWSAAAITTARSGRPYSYDLSGGTYLSGGHESLNGSGGAQYLPTVGRNTLRLPPAIRTDLRVSRAFAVWRGAHGLASVESFNLFNHQSVSSVNQRAFLLGTPLNGVTPLVFQSATEIAVEGLNTTAFGTPTSTGSSLNRAREVELSLKLMF